MATSTIPNPNPEIVTLTLSINTGGSVSGYGKVKICGRVATLSATIEMPTSGSSLIDFGAAWIPGQGSGIYAKYLPEEDVWLSCDYYKNNVTTTAEAKMNTNGVVMINTPTGGMQLKISGSWITKG